MMSGATAVDEQIRPTETIWEAAGQERRSFWPLASSLKDQCARMGAVDPGPIEDWFIGAMFQEPRLISCVAFVPDIAISMIYRQIFVALKASYDRADGVNVVLTPFYVFRFVAGFPQVDVDIVQFIAESRPNRPDCGTFHDWIDVLLEQRRLAYVEEMAMRVVRATAVQDSKLVATTISEFVSRLWMTRPNHRADPVVHVAARLGTSVTAVYRWFDRDDVLLYIGLTGDVLQRQESHAKKSTWSQFAVRGTIEHLWSREKAEAAEKAAIKAECPLFNGTHNDQPDLVQRQVAYLIEHGRGDLLVPMLSRG